MNDRPQKKQLGFSEVMDLLSANVVKALEELNEFENETKHGAVSHLKGIAEKEETCEKDKQALITIAGSLSMSYSEADGGYAPMIVLSNGARSFSMEDLDEEAIAILKETLKVKCPAWMQAQLADILWITEKDYRFAEIATLGYLEEFDTTFDPEHWTTCFDLIQRAYSLTVFLGKKGAMAQRVRGVVNQALDRMNGTDPWFLSLKLIELVGNDATTEEIQRYYTIAEKVFSRNIANGSDNTTLLDTALEQLAQLSKRLKRDKEIPAIRAKLATHYERLADKFSNNRPGGVYNAIHILQQTCRLYEPKKDREKILVVRKRIEELQRIAVNSMPGYPFKFDATKIYNSVKADFEGLSLCEMIVQFGRTATVYDIESIKDQVIEHKGKFFLPACFPGVLKMKMDV